MDYENEGDSSKGTKAESLKLDTSKAKFDLKIDFTFNTIKDVKKVAW